MMHSVAVIREPSDVYPRVYFVAKCTCGEQSGRNISRAEADRWQREHSRFAKMLDVPELEYRADSDNPLEAIVAVAWAWSQLGRATDDGA